MPDEYIFEKSAGEKAFWLSNGQKIDTIKELYNILDNISDDVFSYHVNAERNDFSVWIKGVFQEEELAEKISKLNDRKKAKSAIGEWIYNTVHKKAKSGHKSEKTEHKSEKKKEQRQEIKEEQKHENTEEKSNIVKEIIEDDLEGLHNPRKFLTGVVDFVLGFIVGVLSMLIFINMMG